MEAVRTNIIGTDNVLDSAIQHGVKNVVVLSTDKAPTYQCHGYVEGADGEGGDCQKGRALGDDSNTIISCTRYGNVMASEAR